MTHDQDKERLTALLIDIANQVANFKEGDSDHKVVLLSLIGTARELMASM